MSSSESDRLLTEAIVAGGVGLAAVVVSVFLLVWFGRKVTRDLGGLNTSVREMAEERLPRVVGRLRRGEDVDVLAESPPPGASSIREISTIAESFATVQGAAVAAAVDQARLRKGVSQVFLNISMRNQSLLHRQLKMLDSMERRTSDPDRAGRALPPRPPDHPHAQARRGPHHPVRVHSGPGVARAGARRRRAARGGRRGRGLRQGRRRQRIARPGRGQRGQRHHPPRRRAGGERRGLLAAQHADRGQGRPGRHGPGRGDRGPRPWPERPRNATPSTSAWPARRSSISPTATSSGCSSSASWPPGTASWSRSASRPTAARRRLSGCRSA